MYKNRTFMYFAYISLQLGKNINMYLDIATFLVWRWQIHQTFLVL